MTELDFLFIYEHKVRELENLCLMKYELDKRGYRTKILFINDAKNALAVKPIYHTKVLCMMACYHNKTLRWHVKDFVTFDKIIDMQWENIVYPKDEKREGAYKNYIEVGRNVVHVSWGNQNKTRLLETAHLDPKKVKVVGHIGMDFLKSPLNKYYLSREELFDKYDIPKDKKVILFASPYYSDNLDEEYIADMCSRFGEDWRTYYEFMCQSQKIVLSWFEEICKTRDDIYFIFRPHPGHPSVMVKELEEKYDNFRVLGSDSVKQWIVACDKVYTGNSSVVVEAFFAKKDCQLLFPIPTTDGFELKLISDSKHLTSFEEFKSSLDQENEFPTPQKSIEEIYVVDWETPSYVKFADMAEEVLQDDYYTLTKEQLCNYKEYSLGTKIIKRLCAIDFLYNPYLRLVENETIQWKWIQSQREKRQLAVKIEKDNDFERVSNKEITDVIKQIERAISNAK